MEFFAISNTATSSQISSAYIVVFLCFIVVLEEHHLIPTIMKIEGKLDHQSIVHKLKHGIGILFHVKWVSASGLHISIYHWLVYWVWVLTLVLGYRCSFGKVVGGSWIAKSWQELFLKCDFTGNNQFIQLGFIHVTHIKCAIFNVLFSMSYIELELLFILILC